MGNLVDHARTELRLAGYYDEEAPYGHGSLAIQVLTLIGAFAAQSHSEGSALIVIELFSQLARFNNLTPITDDPEEWLDRTYSDSGPFWQNKRKSSCFSKDSGRTYYDVNEPNDVYGQMVIHSSAPSRAIMSMQASPVMKKEDSE